MQKQYSIEQMRRLVVFPFFIQYSYFKVLFSYFNITFFLNIVFHCFPFDLRISIRHYRERYYNLIVDPSIKKSSNNLNMSTSKNRMAAFWARRVRLATTEQKEARLSVDRRYRRNRLESIRANKNKQEKEDHVIIKRVKERRGRERVELP
jgi:hypothetical protein